MRRILLLVLISFCVISCSSKVQIDIDIPEMSEGEVYIGYQDPQMIQTSDQEQVAKGKLTNGHITFNLDTLDFEGKIKECVVTIMNQQQQFACQMPLPIQKGKTIKLVVTGVKEYMQKISTLKVSYSGSKYAEDFNVFWNDIQNSFLDLVKTNNSPAIYQKQIDIYHNYFEKHPDSGYGYATLLSELRLIREDTNKLVAFAEQLSIKDNKNPWNEYLCLYLKDRKAKKIYSQQLVFSAQNIAGDTITERNINAQITIVDFWASWCKPCLETIPKLESLYQKYHTKGLEIVSISVDTNPNDWLKYAKAKPFKWISVWGNGKELTQRYDFQYIPYMLVVDQKGKVLLSGAEIEKLDQYIDNYLSR